MVGVGGLRGAGRVPPAGGVDGGGDDGGGEDGGGEGGGGGAAGWVVRSMKVVVVGKPGNDMGGEMVHQQEGLLLHAIPEELAE